MSLARVPSPSSESKFQAFEPLSPEALKLLGCWYVVIAMATWNIKRGTSNVERQTLRAGQAMVELVIALLVIVLVISGLTQFIQLSNEKETMMGDLRGEAGVAAIDGSAAASAPKYIVNWQEGGDEMRHTGDDPYTTGSFNSKLGADVLDLSVNNEADWSYISGAVNNDLYNLRTSPGASASLGFVRRSEKKTIELMPAIKEFIIDRDSITVGEEIWMPIMEVH